MAVGRAPRLKTGWSGTKSSRVAADLTGNRIAGRPPKSWTDDLVKIAGTHLKRMAQNWQSWKSMVETYVQQWTFFGYDDADSRLNYFECLRYSLTSLISSTTPRSLLMYFYGFKGICNVVKI